MAELSKYSNYAVNAGINKIDDVDLCIREMHCMKDYDKVKEYIDYKWGAFEGSKEFQYPELSKSINLNISENRIEFRVYKDSNQYHGEYWQLVSVSKEKDT